MPVRPPRTQNPRGIFTCYVKTPRGFFLVQCVNRLTSIFHKCKTAPCMRSGRQSVLTLSDKESVILHLLTSADESELYGLQLVALSKRRLKRGTVYVTLGRMEEKGF